MTGAKQFHANGKLLLTAEYFVLDGALALALPTKRGQSLTCMPASEQQELATLHWQSFDETGTPWFEATFAVQDFAILQATDTAVANRLRAILTEARKLVPAFLPTMPTHPTASTYKFTNLSIHCHLDFPREWGLGTSSTLIHLVAQWAGADAFELQFRTFGGSGYDIACAGADGPLLYRLKDGQPQATPCDFRPSFSDQLYFVYLGKKQDSREGIARYRQWSNGAGKALTVFTNKITALTEGFLAAETPGEFGELMRRHEEVVSEAIGLPRAKSLYFSDFWGEIKSLGAWGGDFVLALSNRPVEETQTYFNEKGFGVFLPYDTLVR